MDSAQFQILRGSKTGDTMTDRPAIDLTRHHFMRELGDLVVFESWAVDNDVQLAAGFYSMECAGIPSFRAGSSQSMEVQ